MLNPNENLFYLVYQIGYPIYSFQIYKNLGANKILWKIYFTRNHDLILISRNQKWPKVTQGSLTVIKGEKINTN